MSRRILARLLFGLVLLGGFAALPGRAYIEAPHSLGEVVNKSSNILVITITAVDKEKKTISYRKAQDLKGKHPSDVVKTVCNAELRPGEIVDVFRWAEPGKTAVMFYAGGAAEICYGTGWYQVNAAGEWWTMTHGEPFLTRTYFGRVPKLAALVAEIQTGKEVLVPCLRETGNRDDIFLKRAKSQKLKASMKLLTYDQTRDFAGYGGAEDITAVRGMPMFSQSVSFGRLDGRALAAQVIDFDGDGRPDACLVSQGKVVISRNEGDSYSDVSLPNPPRGVRAACWGDLDGDGRPDLLVACVDGLKLYTNQGAAFRDDSALLPPTPPSVAGVAVIDVDRDGQADVVYADGFSGLHVLMNRPAGPPEVANKPKFGEWRAIGPFPPENAFATAFGPEQDASPAKTFSGKRNEQVAWKPMKFEDGKSNDLKLFGGSGNNACCYLAREIQAPAAADVPAVVAADDCCKLWVNGQQLYADPAPRTINDKRPVTLKLKAGKNLLLMKVVQSTGDWAFFFKADGVESKTVQRFLPDDRWLPAAIPDSPINSLAVAELNGDGRPDLVCGSPLAIQPWLSKPDGTYAPSKPLTLSPTDAAPALGDLNGDGLADLFIPSRVGKHRLLINRAGDFAESASPLPGESSGALIGDLNGDGKADLLVAVWRGPNRLLLGDGTGRFTDATEAAGLHQKVYNSSAFALGDFNNDGLADLLMANDGQDSLALFAAPSTKALPSVRWERSWAVRSPNTEVRLKDAGGKVVARACGDTLRAAEGRYTLEWTGLKGVAMSRPVEVKGPLTRLNAAEEAKK